jgi:hypothetical protein
MAAALAFLQQAQAALANDAALLAARQEEQAAAQQAHAADVAARTGALELERQALAGERAALEVERARLPAAIAAAVGGGGGGGAADVLTLNVGGQLFSVQRRTLTCAHGSVLGALFGGAWDASHTRDADGRPFLDVDPDTWSALLRLLRVRAASDAAALGATPPAAGVVPTERSHLVLLADKWLLRDTLWPAAFAADAARVLPAGKRVCAVTVARAGRLLRVCGGVKLQPEDESCVQDQWETAHHSGTHQKVIRTPPQAFASFFRYAQPSPGAFMNSTRRRPRNGVSGAAPFGAAPFVDMRFAPLASHHSLCKLPSQPHGTSATTWCVRLCKLSEGAMLGVATSPVDVYGVMVLCDADADAAVITASSAWITGSRPKAGRGRRMRMAVVVAGMVTPIPDSDEWDVDETLAWGQQDGRMLVFVLSAAAADGSRLLTVSCECDTDLVPHGLHRSADSSAQQRQLCLRLPGADGVAPDWQMYVQPMPGDEVELGYALDMWHPEEGAC